MPSWITLAIITIVICFAAVAILFLKWLPRWRKERAELKKAEKLAHSSGCKCTACRLLIK